MRVWNYIPVAVVACAFYYNALWCGFVFDDISAVRDNRDLRPQTSLLNLFVNDFWGTPIQKEHSHKSYRPLCVLTFRLNYAFDGLNPIGYHLVNVLLHATVCCLYVRLCSLFLPDVPSVVAGLLFAVHPIHTEAVTGIVGRAETLSSVFFVMAFLCYVKCTRKRRSTDWTSLFHCVMLVAIATFCKEQGITVVGVCCVYEVFLAQKLRLYDLLHILQSCLAVKVTFPSWFREMVSRISILVSGAACLLFARLKIMGAQLPVFTKFDNPAAVSDTPTRQLTYNYLLAVNSWLLLFPCDLCCDWTMGTIPLVESFLDVRNLATVVFYLVFGAVTWCALSSNGIHSHVLIMSLALIVLPFLPASNLFFPVGFVIAERILYTPSMGFCMLVAYGWYLLYQRVSWKQVAIGGLFFVLCVHAAKTWNRNYDWETEYSIFMSGLRVNKRNAKLYNNVGHALESQGLYKEALEYFQTAARVQPNDIGAHMNVGRTFNNLHMYSQAEEAFIKAKNLLPRARPGEKYQARIAPSHLNVFLNLANLIARNGSRLEEADALYRQAISMRADYTQAYINRGDILLKLNRTQEAQEFYERALQFDNSNPDIYYNLGVVFLEQGKGPEALVYFNKALELEPEHEQALMNSAILIQENGTPNMRKIASQRLKTLIDKGRANERVYFNLGMLAMDDKDYVHAEKHFRKAIQIRDDFRSALFNLALLLSDSNRPLEAVPFLKQLLKHHSDHVKGLILLGDIYINHVRDLDAAEECYHKILQLDPTNVQGLHNLCVVHVERGKLGEAEKCLEKAVAMAPDENYIQRHLRIVRARLHKVMQQRKLRESTTSASSPTSRVMSSSVTSPLTASSRTSGSSVAANIALENHNVKSSQHATVVPSASPDYTSASRTTKTGSHAFRSTTEERARFHYKKEEQETDTTSS